MTGNMPTIQRVFWAHLLLATAGLAAGYVFAGQTLFALGFALAGALWFAAQQRVKNSLGGLMLFIFSAGGALGFLLGLPGWLILLSVLATLGAWDLDHFLQRLSAVERVEYGSGIGRAHIQRLLLVEGSALALGLLALAVQARIPFWWEVLLALLGMLGLSRLVGYIRQHTEG